MSRSLAKSVLLLGAMAASASCRGRKDEIVVFYASSLSAVLGDAAELYRQQHPQTQLRLEPSGSQVAIRKVSELGMRADIVAVADAGLLAKAMIPAHAQWSVLFATNEIVIGHKDHSKGTDQLTTENWPAIVTRPGVRLGRADPDTAPIGYQTLMVWQLAERSGLYGDRGPGLEAALEAQCAKQHVTHDEAELLALLESRAIDYAFLFRSTAEDHHLKITALPPEMNLSRADLAAAYANVQVDVRMKQGQERKAIVGAPITYALTMPASAPHRAEAERFLALFLGGQGRRLLQRRGFHVVAPSCAPCDGLPDGMAELISAKAP